MCHVLFRVVDENIHRHESLLHYFRYLSLELGSTDLFPVPGLTYILGSLFACWYVGWLAQHKHVDN